MGTPIEWYKLPGSVCVCIFVRAGPVWPQLGNSCGVILATKQQHTHVSIKQPGSFFSVKISKSTQIKTF